MGEKELLTDLHTEIFIRIVVSVIFGFAIGLEREVTNKSAGLRTQALVCLGSTIYTLMSVYGFDLHTTSLMLRNDPARVAAQITSGVGFIGAGVVLRHGTSVYGLTTAATLWVSAAIGMAVGVGSFFAATVGTLVTVLVLISLRALEKNFLSKITKKVHKIRVNVICSSSQALNIQDFIFKKYEKVLEFKEEKLKYDQSLVSISFLLSILSNNPINSVTADLKNLDNIESLSIARDFATVD